MGRRLDLHHKLRSDFESVTGMSSDKRVYYQPPASVKLSYPCILYKLSDIPSNFANNLPYKIEHAYELTVIDTDPNSPLREKIARYPLCSMSRAYESDNLHHYVFQIYD